MPEAHTWQHSSFTHPTRCPECGEPVYFIRHNDGCVWVDELGWPWPKHACFDQPHTETAAFHDWAKKLANHTNPNLGVVACIRPSTSGESHFIEVNLSNGDQIGFFLAWMPPQASLLGALVVISRQDHLLIHPEHGEIAMHGVVDLGPSGGANDRVPLARCGFCHSRGIGTRASFPVSGRGPAKAEGCHIFATCLRPNCHLAF